MVTLFPFQVFCKLFSLQIEEDVNEVIFALNSESNIDFTSPEASDQLQKLLNVKHLEVNKSILDSAKKIIRLDG